MRTFPILPYASRILLTCMLVVFPAGSAVQGQISPPLVNAELEAALESAREGTSEARQRLAVRRIIRDAEKQMEALAQQSERWAVLEFIFRAQQQLIKLDKDAKHRQALIETCRELVEAPDEFAELRMDADLLLSQAKQAQKGASPGERAEALRPFIARYVDTPAGAKALRVTMVMALELGDTRLVNDLRKMIVERFSKDLEMITFQRDKLGGQVLGVPFFGYFKRSDGKTVCYPMDTLGHSSMILFWSKEDQGALQYLADLAAAAKADQERVDGRLEFISVNLDELPDAGESIIRSMGADWQVLHLPGGRDNPFYDAYVRVDLLNKRVAPTGQTALMEREKRRKPEPAQASELLKKITPSKDFERLKVTFHRTLIRGWSRDDYALNLSALMTGDFLIFEPEGDFDPSRPPELKATTASGEVAPLDRSADSVPEETLQVIQDCLIPPPQRYHSRIQDIRAAYQKMVELCRQAIAERPDAPDLWIVRNRLIIALVGLWKTDFELAHFEAAVAEAKIAMELGNYPAGTDVIPRFTLARQALRDPKADHGKVIDAIVANNASGSAPGPAFAVATLLSLDVADQARYQNYRQVIVENHTENPSMWLYSGFLLDRYHDYWIFQLPFNAGWSFTHRLRYEMKQGDAEPANRMLRAVLPTMDGGIFRIPEDLVAEYTAIFFAQPSPWKTTNHEDPNPPSPRRIMARFPNFALSRPDVHYMVAMLAGGDEAAIRKDVQLRGSEKQPEPPILIVPGGMKDPLVYRLGLLSDDQGMVLLNKKGKILTVRSGFSSRDATTALENIVLRQDEKAVNDALERGDIEAAKEQAFELAPPYDPEAVDERGRKLRKPKHSTAHLSARAKVYMALKEWDKALADAEEVYSREFSQAGGLSLRTEELDQAEALRDEILNLKQADR